MHDLLRHNYFGNSGLAYSVAIGFLVAGWLGVWVLKAVVLSRLKRWAEKTETSLDDFLLKTVEETVVPVLYVSVLLAAVKGLTLPGVIEKTLSILWATVIMLAVVRVVLGLVRHAVYEIWLPRREDKASLERSLKVAMPILTISVWCLGLILLLDNLGFKINAIIAGLGIGGVAVALAAQAVLGDLFGYFSIVFDRPFELDDFITVGDFQGTIEQIGIKTTRLRSLTGEELIISNKDLTDSRIRNHKRMTMRRVVFKLGLTYDTSSEKLQKAVTIVKDILLHTPDTRFDRAHFASYGDWSLNIEAIYFVLSADYIKYMDIQQDINFRVKDAFEKEGLDFAFPSQTVYQAPDKPTPRTRPEPSQTLP